MDQFRKSIVPSTNDSSLPIFDLNLAQQLYEWIVAPLETEMQAKGIDNLAFLMDNNLRSLPVAAGVGTHYAEFQVGQAFELVDL